jgi:hypothetical protein
MPEAARAQAAPARADSCVAAGPLHCDAAPAADTEVGLCAQLRACELTRAPSHRSEPLDTITRCTQLAPPTSLPAGLGIGALALVRLEGETAAVDDVEQAKPGQAAYLAVERDGRWCAAAQLLPFSTRGSGPIEDAIKLRFDASRSRAYVDAQRIKRGNLDADERAKGVSDVEYEGCDQHLFALDAEAGLRLVRSKWTTPAACDGLTAAFAADAASAPAAARVPDAGRCSGRGPLACDLGAEQAPDKLCARLTACMAHETEPWLLRQVETCSALTQRTPLATTGGGVAVLRAQGKLGARAAESAFLISEAADGYCLIDQLFDAAPEYSMKPPASFELIRGEADQLLTVISRHAYRRPRASSGESELGAEQEVLSYRVERAAFTRDQQQTLRER